MGESETKFSVKSGYLLIERPEGHKVVLSEQRAMLAELSDACNAAGCSKVLILGRRTIVRLSIFDIYELGKSIATIGLQIAIADNPDVTNKETGFLENVAFNRGANLRFFDNEQDAKDWLGVK